jgi:hypothetical protein
VNQYRGTPEQLPRAGNTARRTTNLGLANELSFEWQVFQYPSEIIRTMVHVQHHSLDAGCGEALDDVQQQRAITDGYQRLWKRVGQRTEPSAISSTKNHGRGHVAQSRAAAAIAPVVCFYQNSPHPPRP